MLYNYPMQRYLFEYITKDLRSKTILLSGPRQVGKTTLAKSLSENFEYLNYDIVGDRKIIMNQGWRKDKEIIILDEIHKFRKWKNYIKGVIDQHHNIPPVLVTGSARLEIFRKAGDALTGRTFSYHLHPIDLEEACLARPTISPSENLSYLLEYGGFPESFFKPELSQRLLNDRLATVLREDLRDISEIGNIKGIELLVELLRERVGGGVTYSNLANDLSISPPTVKSWVETLEKLYLIFLVRPYAGNFAKSFRKEPKVYFYDCSAAHNGAAAKLENLVALALLKWSDLQRDAHGRNISLQYYRDTNNREVDFVVTESRSVLACIEVKSSDDSPSSALAYLAERVKPKHTIQLVQNLYKELDVGQIKVRNLAEWLKKIAL